MIRWKTGLGMMAVGIPRASALRAAPAAASRVKRSPSGFSVIACRPYSASEINRSVDEGSDSHRRQPQPILPQALLLVAHFGRRDQAEDGNHAREARNRNRTSLRGAVRS